jgi:hypothetical protein
MVDKTKSIKDATDKELDELLIRLSKESQLQNLVGDLKRKSTPNNSFSNSFSYDRPEVSTEASIESLYHKADDVLTHFGIPGMHWGRRRGASLKEIASSSATSKKEKSEDFEKSREIKKKGYKHLSTKELKDLTQRMQLEKTLRELTVSDYSKGLDVVKAVTAAGTTIAAAYALSQTPLGQAVKKKLLGK